MAGSFGDLSIFSFGFIKPVQGGEGGIIATDDEALAKELRSIRSYGDRFKEFSELDHTVLSWNGRMSEIVAAVVLQQFRLYPQHLAQIRDHISLFKSYLQNYVAIEVIDLAEPGFRSSYTQLVLKINSDILGYSKNELMNLLDDHSIYRWYFYFEITFCYHKSFGRS